MTYVYGYSTIASLVASQTKNAMPRQLLQYSPLTKAQFDIQMLRLSSISKLCIVASRQASRRTQFVQPRFVTFSFVEEANQNTVVVDAKEGKSVLDIAIENNIDIEGACGGELACSTCHVITTPELFAKLPPKTEEEEDMLDLAWGLTDTSRLCCQLRVTKDLEGAVFRVPAETNNML